MRCITVQHKSVYEDYIKKNKKYRANYTNVSDILVKPYKFMQDYFNWKSTPIFLVPEGHYIEMGGAKFRDGSVAIELDIPDKYVKIQRYYDWSDFIYFTENSWEFEGASNVDKFKTVEDWAKTIMDIKDSIAKADEYKDPLQATIEFILPSWLICVSYNLDKLAEMHDQTGGRNKLNRLRDYV